MARINKDLDEKQLQYLVDICNQINIGFRVEPDQIRITRFNQGLASDIYRIDFNHELLATKKPIPDQTIVVKIFGPDPPYDVIKSRINSIMIGLEKLGPKVLLFKDRAVVMQYINGRSFTHRDDFDEKLVRLLAHQLAHFHSLNVPIAKNVYEDQIKYILEDWMNEEMWSRINNPEFIQNLQKNNCNNLIQGDLRNEFRCLENRIMALEPNLVFAHQDLNHSNIFIVDNNQEPDIKFIDFDYSGYNFRALDLGRYFADCGKTQQFSNEDIIDDEKMLSFIHHYIDANCSIHGEQYRQDPKNSPTILLLESKLFIMLAQWIDIFFCLWIAIKEPDKRNEFSKQAESRYENYLAFKKRIQNDHLI